MENYKIQLALEAVAKQHGISRQEVEAEIAQAIAAAYETAQTQQNPQVLAIWQELQADDALPTPQAFLAFLLQRLS